MKTYNVYFTDNPYSAAKFSGTKKEENGGLVTAYVYRQVKDRWQKVDHITESAFRAGLSRGTVKLV